MHYNQTIMKRNKELIKAILLYAEKQEDVIFEIQADELLINPTNDELKYHLQMMQECGLLKGSPRKGERVIITGITWAGYEFLENAREAKVWNAAKQAAGNLSWGVFVSVLTETATEYAKSILKQIL
jgi:hypothetical protein